MNPPLIDFRTEQMKRHNGTQRTVEGADEPLIWVPTTVIGPMIRAARHRRGWSLTRLMVEGEIYRDVGTLARVERSEKDVDYTTLCRIADVLQDERIVAVGTDLVLRQLRLPVPEVA